MAGEICYKEISLLHIMAAQNTKSHTLLEVNFCYVLMVLSVRYAGVREKRTLSFEQKTIYKQASLSIKCVTNANKVLKLLVYQIYFGIII